MTAPHCLLVDDDEELRRSVGAYLERYGFEVTAVGSGAELEREFTRTAVDIVLLDLMLPDADGLELCRWMRRTRATPVVMLTAQGDPISRVIGLELGADDYVAKPFEPRELVARMHAVLRRARGAIVAAPPPPGSVQFAGWRLERLQRLLVSPEGVAMAVSNAEFRLLSAFVEHAGRVLSRERLVELTGAAGGDVGPRSVDLAVSRLRQKLGDGAHHGGLIETVRGEGYRFRAQVVA